MKAYFGLHISAALFGLAGLFGRWLSIDPLWIVEGRVVFASITIALLLLFSKIGFRLERAKDHYQVILLGAVLAFHWYAFFRSIQETTMALALLSFASFPFFTLLIEAFWQKKGLKLMEWLLVLLSFLGTVLIIPWNPQSANFTGVLWGLSSGFSFAIMAILNKGLVARYHPLQLSFYQDFWAALVLLPLCLSQTLVLSLEELSLLFLLGTVFTALSHTLFINALKRVEARTAALIAALEPVYGIIAAFFLFSEMPASATFIGGTLILGAGIMAQFRDPSSV